MAVTLTAWHLESTDRVRLVGAVELVVTGSDRTVHDHVIRGSEPVSSELPGDLAAAAGRLLQRLASASLTRVIQGAGGDFEGLEVLRCSRCSGAEVLEVLEVREP